MNVRMLEGEYVQLGELDKFVAECRLIASRLGLRLAWRIKARTATAFIKFNGHILWRADYTADMPHRLMCKMYAGVYTELARRDNENKAAILQMRMIEEEREKERKISALPSWAAKRRA